MEKDSRRTQEITEKISHIRHIIIQRNLSGILLTQQYNVCWLTAGGNNHVLWDDQNSLISIFITADRAVVIAENGDITRVKDEEFFNYPFEYHNYEWYKTGIAREVLKIAAKGKIGADAFFADFNEQENINGYLCQYRSVLKPFEAERCRAYGTEVASIVTDAAMNSKPGMRENEIAAFFASECIKKGFTIFVQLLGGDERSIKYRHQVVTGNIINKHYSFCAVGRKEGFTYPINRVVSFGEPKKTLADNNKKIETVYALLNSHAKIGTNLSEIYEKLPEIYEAADLESDEWKNHTIGGTVGYLAREHQLADGVDYVLEENNLIGWNPSLPGTMAEDVYLLKKDGLEYITNDKRWPQQLIEIGGIKSLRPEIMVL